MTERTLRVPVIHIARSWYTDANLAQAKTCVRVAAAKGCHTKLAAGAVRKRDGC